MVEKQPKIPGIFVCKKMENKNSNRKKYFNFIWPTKKIIAKFFETVTENVKSYTNILKNLKI